MKRVCEDEEIQGSPNEVPYGGWFVSNCRDVVGRISELLDELERTREGE